jgi:HEXXH motif-containing protein
MSADQLSAWIEEEYRDGLAYFAGLGRTLAEHRLSDYGRLSPHLSDRLYLEPLLFTHCTTRAPDRYLWQICFGYADAAYRPATVFVRTDDEGVICLPQVGYLVTNRPGQDLKLRWESASRNLALFRQQQSIPHEFLPLRNVAGTSIDICCHAHPLLGPLIGEPGCATRKLTQAHLAHIDRAFAIIRHVYPVYARTIAAVTSRLVLFQDSSRNSFATLSSFGTAFFNVTEPDPDEVFFIEDIAHQCGHILFSALTHEVDDFLAVRGDTPLGDQTSTASETRTVYTTLHGLFTEAVMSQCLDRCLRMNVFSGKQRHECLGRFAYIFLRFYHDLMSMKDRSLYTDKGARLYAWLCDIFRDIHERQSKQLGLFNLRDQPYTFSFDVFQRHNPLERTRRAAPERLKRVGHARAGG